MAFFEQIGKKITNAGQSVAQQTKNFADIAQINSSISEKEKRISQLFLNIGQAYYTRHKEDQTSEFCEIIEEIKGLYLEIEKNQEKIKEIKGVIKCPNCGADMPFNAVFCNACGVKVKEDQDVSEKNEMICYCPACNSVVDEDDLFCNHCGTKIEKN